MFKAFAQFFAAMFTLFSAVEKSASALDHLANYANESAEHLTDKARLERKAEIASVKEQLKVVDKAAA